MGYNGASAIWESATYTSSPNPPYSLVMQFVRVPAVPAAVGEACTLLHRMAGVTLCTLTRVAPPWHSHFCTGCREAVPFFLCCSHILSLSRGRACPPLRRTVTWSRTMALPQRKATAKPQQFFTLGRTLMRGLRPAPSSSPASTEVQYIFRLRTHRPSSTSSQRQLWLSRRGRCTTSMASPSATAGVLTTSLAQRSRSARSATLSTACGQPTPHSSMCKTASRSGQCRQRANTGDLPCMPCHCCVSKPLKP